MSARPYFAFFPGDYLADTMGLSCCEHGVYLLLLAASWQRGPLPDNMDHLARLAANPPIEALRFVLESYWTRTERGWINARLERERKYIEQKSTKARNSALARWGNNANAQRTQCERIATEERPQSGRNATHTHTQRKKTPPTPPRGESLEETPDGVDARAWADFFAHRREIRKPLTPRAATKAANLLKAYRPEQQREMVDTTVCSGWTGLFPPKGKVNREVQASGLSQREVQAAARPGETYEQVIRRLQQQRG